MQEPEKEFTPYEFWIFILTVFHSNQYTQSLSISQQQALLQVIRKKHAPSITNKDWLNIELNIVKNRNTMMDSMLQSASASAGITEHNFNTDEMTNFNYLFSQELDSFDLDGIRQQLKQNGVTNPRLNDLLDLLESKKNTSPS